jgi:hypothetical protein
VTEELRFHTVEALQALPLEALQALWELVPTDRQRAYRAAYDREVRSAGAIGSDALEQQVAEALLSRYSEAALVPIGTRWARTPSRVQTAAAAGAALDASESEEKPTVSTSSPRVLAAFGLAALLLLGFVLTRPRQERSSEAAQAAAAVSPTPTPRVSPTPTPLALEAQDDVIAGGDRGRAAAYPVSLQIVLPDKDAAPRVWVVQRRAVRAAEWHYDPNPDVASFVSGMSVRPVIGIPYSEDNAAWFAAVGEGTTFYLTMNTGAILRYEFAAKTDVRRSDTAVFRQVRPGLVLLLIGETSPDGLPTAARTLVTAVYPPEQELSRSGQLVGAGLSLPEVGLGEALALGDEAALTLRAVWTAAAHPGLPLGQQALAFELEVSAGVNGLDLTPWQMEVHDWSGQVYTPSALALDAAGLSAPPVTLPPLARMTVHTAYLVPAAFSGGRLVVTNDSGQTAAFRFALPPPEAETRPDGVHAQLVSVATLDGQIIVQLRLYNPQSTPVTFTADDIWLSLGYAPDPPGPRSPAEGMPPFELRPEQAADLRLVWPWSNEPYAALQVGGRRWAVQLTRGA